MFRSKFTKESSQELLILNFKEVLTVYHALLPVVRPKLQVTFIYLTWIQRYMTILAQFKNKFIDSWYNKADIFLLPALKKLHTS